MLEKELAVARACALEAGKLQLGSFKSLKKGTVKSDGSPVTRVDTRCERLIRSAIRRAFPSDGFVGEEYGERTGTSGRRWIVDPLDGTRPFLRGIPTFSVLIALEQRRELLLGVIHLPALGELYHATSGGGAFCDNRPIHVSTIARLGDAVGSALGYIEKTGTRRADRLCALMRRWDYAYGFMDAYSYAALASGRLDLCVSLLDKPWDCAAGACIVREAGGRFSDLRGRENIRGNSILLSNGVLHEAALNYFVGPAARRSGRPSGRSHSHGRKGKQR